MNLKGHKIITRLQLVASITVVAFIWVFVFPQEAITGEMVQIPAGTKVILKTAISLQPKDFKVGDRVNLIVASDVVVDGKVVIKKGAPALGEVTVSEVIGEDKLTISIKSVEAVDGTPVIVSGTESMEGAAERIGIGIIAALFCLPLILIPILTSPSISEHTKIKAIVVEQTTINVNGV